MEGMGGLWLYSVFQLYVASAFRRTEKDRLKPATTYNRKALLR